MKMLVPAASCEAEQFGERSVMGGLPGSAKVEAACFWNGLPPSAKKGGSFSCFWTRVELLVLDCPVYASRD